MAEHNDTGREGEDIARLWLVDKGYHVLAVNWRWRHLELDIIAEKDQHLVVVEVKTRSEDFLLSPQEAVDERKIKRIVAATDAYVRYFYKKDYAVRFDLITILKGPDAYRVEHIEDAFLAPAR